MMSRYTSTVFEILQYYAEMDENVTNINDMTAISARTLFSNAPLNVLSETARENFITQFTLHYLKDELGFETLTLWQLALAEKLYNNADYINAVYENLKKQAYSEYAKRNNISNGTRSRIGTYKDIRTDDLNTDSVSSNNSNSKSSRDNTGSRVSDGYNNNVQTNDLTSNSSNSNFSNAKTTRDNTGSQSTDGFRNNLQTNDLRNTSTENGLNIQSKTGSDVTRDRGTQTNDNNLTDRTVHDTTDRSNYNSQNQLLHATEDRTSYGSVDTQSFGSTKEFLENNKHTEKNIKIYDVVSEKSFENREQEKTFTDRQNEKSFSGTATDTNDSRTDKNGLGLTFDSPQGSLDELRDPGGTPGEGNAGKGIAYAAGQSYNYFSSAAENDESAWNHSTNTKSFDNYKEITKDTGSEKLVDKGKEITTDKYNIDGTTKKDEHEVTNRFVGQTVEITDTAPDGTTQTRYLNGDVTVNGGSDVNRKTGTDTLSKTGTDTDSKTGYDETIRTGNDTTTRTGNTMRLDNLDHTTEYGSAVNDSRNMTTDQVQTGTVSDNSIDTSRTVDDLHEVSNNENNSLNVDTSQTKGTISDIGANGSRTTDDLHEISNNENNSLNVGNIKSTGTVQNDRNNSDFDVSDVKDDSEEFKINFLQWTMQPRLMDKIWEIFDDLFMWLLN